MTQALLNNLCNIAEGKFELKDKICKDSGADFAKIFDSANKISKNSIKTDNDTNANTNTSAYDLNKFKKEVKDIVPNQNSDNQITTDDNGLSNTLIEENNTELEIVDTATESIDTDTNDVSTNVISLRDVILEAAIETLVEECVTEDDADIQYSGEINTEEAEETEETITENNINEEAPTMYKELNTLENPAASIMMQSQIKLPKLVSAENSSSEMAQNRENLTNLNNTSLNSNLKQFDNQVIKTETLNYAEVEDAKINTKAESPRAKLNIDNNMVNDLKLAIVDSETSAFGSGSEEFMQNTSPQEQVVKVMIQGDIKPGNNFETAIKTEMLKPDTVNPSKIIEQVSKQLENLNGNSKLTMILNPESLGKINIQLMSTKAGLAAQFTVTTPEARDLLMKGLEGLKENLLSQGIAVDNVNIKLEEAFSKEEGNSDWTEQEGSRGGYKQQGNKHSKDEKKQQFEQFMFDYENGNV